MKIFVFFLTGYCSAAQARSLTHEVSTGDTLAQIAKQYQVPSTAIQKLNHLRGKKLRVGQELLIPNQQDKPTRLRSSTHRVHKGESIAHIAKTHGMSLAALRRMNPRIKNRLQVGQLIRVKEDSEARIGNIDNFAALEPQPGFDVMDTKKAWGTKLTVKRVTEVLTAHHQQYPDGSPLLVGDISKERGGFLPPHKSHRRGRDIDIRYPLLTPAPKHQYAVATSKTLDVEQTWDLIKAFVDTGDVEYIFMDFRIQKILINYAEENGYSKSELSRLFQHPRGRRSVVGIVRHEKGHRTHFHVRFRPEREEQESLPTS